MIIYKCDKCGETTRISQTRRVLVSDPTDRWMYDLCKECADDLCNWFEFLNKEGTKPRRVKL